MIVIQSSPDLIGFVLVLVPVLEEPAVEHEHEYEYDRGLHELKTGGLWV